MRALLLLLILVIGFSMSSFSQTADLAFHSASKLYIDQKDKEAAQLLDQAIRQFPNDQRLKNLRDQIKEEEKKEQEKKEQEKKEQEKKEQEKKDQEKKDQQNKKDQKEKEEQKSKEEKEKEQKEKEQKEKEQQEKEQQEKKEKDKDKKDPSTFDNPKDIKISPQKAQMILDAMKTQERQYLQQNKRKASKPKEKGKPDW